MRQAVVFLCTKDELTRERRGYFKAFLKEVQVICIDKINAYNYYELREILASYTDASINIRMILDVDAFPRFLPHGLTEAAIPTGCFQIDTYEQTKRRISSSMLFDYAFVFHPGYDVIFCESGHPRPVCLAHAVEADLFTGEAPERIYDIGWVGRTDLSFYSFRRRCLEGLVDSFKMNDPNRHYSLEEMANVYKQSKIVVNLSRDDYLQDANLRCFEAMAAGALLITPKPTELSALGFVEGLHYVPFQREEELKPLVEFYLQHDVERSQIASAAQALVMQSHTYDSRIRTILDTLNQDHGELFAPARSWDVVRVQSVYSQYFMSYLMVEAAVRELYSLRQLSRSATWKMFPELIRVFLKMLKMLM